MVWKLLPFCQTFISRRQNESECLIFVLYFPSALTGNENYDWEELQRNAEYKNGYTENDDTIRIFWEVFHELPEEEKRKFLLYLTGSVRIPIQGMKAIKVHTSVQRQPREIRTGSKPEGHAVPGVLKVACLFCFVIAL
jgi:hypothetical protein